ncbi:hypothetical protein [Thiocystis violascens]|uniref:Uncharacterized protein n=1 Tax=Thiocystis violascens (strain ATCC 17096 / DSM 198 / 6111) TaxID=765911 RepID=I3YFW4_THIV6|nr:hypothetical protein [Thiocystis violascens]AFL75882.1 hypothetical protein Thivi_4059 [Thiocystis violascens DSM 198]
MKNLIDQVARKFNRARFLNVASKILATPPLALGHDNGAVVATMLQHKDMLMYLLALKSFARWIPVSRVVVVNDGSLGSEDLRILAAHVPGIKLLALEKFRSDQCPVGGCWERLLAITELTREAYVIQLDADTLTLGDLAEVREHVQVARPFTIATWDKQEIEPMAMATESAKESLSRHPNKHVQLVTEASFAQLTDYQNLNYVRGCAGFMGFASGSLDRRIIECFSKEIRSIVGPVWETWGSEQVMANIMLANAPDAVVLPHPRYCDCNRILEKETKFVHFIGSCRFSDKTYIRMAQKVTTDLLIIAGYLPKSP